jgi:multidrug efflux pump subunit AcrA (membrane-fusion protein)
VDAAAGTVEEKEAEVGRADAYRTFREKERRRFQGLAAGGSPGITADVVDEQTQQYESAVAASRAARGAVQKAKAELAEAQAKSEAARADVDLKEALVEVAKKDRDRARAMLGLAELRAPFDGVVTRRNADPGSFVQNAATAHTEPVLSLARTDIITVYTKLPDIYAPYVTRDTEVLIEMGVLPGWQIRGKVTRFSPSLETPEHDRTMRVEVDLYNGTAAEYQQFLQRAKASGYARLKDRALPMFPAVKGKPTAGLDGRLLPGMFGKMRLLLRSFPDACLIPSTALVAQGGRSFVYLVRDGRAVRAPVEVQVDDGRVAKVVLIEKAAGGQEVRRELTGDDVVITSNQGELSDGQAVRAGEPGAW